MFCWQHITELLPDFVFPDDEEEEGLLDSGSIPIPLFEDELSHASANGHILPHDIKGCLLVGSPSVQTASWEQIAAPQSN